ncbi:hypothetical protein KIPB_003518 [Kipferlia bialata]|uniref:CCHC-type domain-containing protein n=1 Tax=Kipferlia bialata TaxID=797122 RepID=A0A9K3CUK8_9EUKA|nr:hypothetical protein KIPB_003518 [Kipferlia bialata]|eukprot:g3518.t1
MPPPPPLPQVSADCFWVRPDQVSKTAESGQYLGVGSFIIRGRRRNIQAPPLEMGVGILWGRADCGDAEREVEQREREAVETGSERQTPSERESTPRVEVWRSLYGGTVPMIQEGEDDGFLEGEAGDRERERAGQADSELVQGLVGDAEGAFTQTARRGKGKQIQMSKQQSEKEARREEKRLKKQERQARLREHKKEQRSKTVGKHKGKKTPKDAASAQGETTPEETEEEAPLCLCTICGQAGHTEKECPDMAVHTQLQAARVPPSLRTADQQERERKQLERAERAELGLSKKSATGADQTSSEGAASTSGCQAIRDITGYRPSDDSTADHATSCHLMVGPYSAVQQHCVRCVRFVPGLIKRSNTADLVKRVLLSSNVKSSRGAVTPLTQQEGALMKAIPDAVLVPLLPDGNNLTGHGVGKIVNTNMQAKKRAKADRKKAKQQDAQSKADQAKAAEGRAQAKKGAKKGQSKAAQERIAAIERELNQMQKNKGTETHRGMLRSQLAKLKAAQ